jgi:hypothetical protein
MFDALFILSIVGAAVQVIQESSTKPIPAENWANKKLYHKDIMDGVSVEQRLKNLENGKYKLSECDTHIKEVKKEVRTKTEFEKRYGL